MLGILLLSSCRSNKGMVTTPGDSSSPEQARFESVVSNQYKYEALQSKSRYSMASASLGGKLCLESGRRLCLQVNAPLLGFEVARIEASQDSVIVVDKYDKQYCVVRLADFYDLKELSGHELEALESIMLGRIYIPGIGQASKRDYRQLVWQTPALNGGGFGNSVGSYRGEGYSIDYTIDASGRLVSTLLTVGDRSALWQYSGYQEVTKGKWVPTQEDITVTDSDRKSFKAGIALTSPELGESSWRSFEPTSSYKKVPISELVKTVKSLIR